MRTNDIKKLKKDYKSLRDDFEDKTNFKLEFIEEPSSYPVKAGCFLDFDNKILKIRLRKGLTEDDYIHVIHELFHGILWIKEGFSYVFKKHRDPETQTVRDLISTYIDDIVVHRRLLLLGYNPIDPNYSSDVENNLNLIQRGKSHLALNIHGTGLAGNLLKTLYYIHVKDYRKNYKDCFDETSFKNLKKFIKTFPYKSSFRCICEIEKLLKKHDIFSPLGNDLIKKKIIEMVGMENKIEVKKCI